MISVWIGINLLTHLLILYAISMAFRLNKRTGIMSLIFYLAMIFAYLPYATLIPGGELQRAYISLINHMAIPKYGYDQEKEVEPLLFIHWLTLKSFYHYAITDTQASLFLRFFAYSYILYIGYRISLIIHEKYNLAYSYVIVTVILIGLDWHFGLLICDELRNLFGLMFYLYVIYDLLKNNWRISLKNILISSILALLIHKSFIFLIPLSYVIALSHNVLYKYLKIEYVMVLALPVLIIVKKLLDLFVALTHIISPDKINHNLINTGISEIMHPGMFAQALISAGMIWLIFWNRKWINHDKFLYPIAFLTVFLAITFVLPLVDIRFVEYERIFYSFAPLVLPFLILLIFKTFTPKSILVILASYAVYDFMINATFIDIVDIFTDGYNNLNAIASSTGFILLILCCLVWILSKITQFKTLFQLYGLFVLSNYVIFTFLFHFYTNQSLFLNIFILSTFLTFFVYSISRLKVGK